MTTTATTTGSWWTPVTTVIAVTVSTMGLFGLALGETTSGSGMGVLVAAAPPAVGGLLMLAGLAVRRTRALTGSRLVIAGAVLAAFDPIFIPLSALVIIGGLWTGNLATSEERADTIRLHVTRRSMTDGWYRWLLAGFVIAAVGMGAAVVGSAVFDTERCTEANPCWEGTAVWATFVVSLLGGLVTGGIGIVLGVLRLVSRHHTRHA